MKDPEKRKIYDEYGEEGLTNWEKTKDYDPFDFFNKNKDKEKLVELSITLEEAYNGGKKEVEYDRVIICPNCKGSGSSNPNEKPTTCLKCSGSGKKIIIKIIGFFITQSEICDECNGEGKIIKEKGKNAMEKKS